MSMLRVRRRRRMMQRVGEIVTSWLAVQSATVDQDRVAWEQSGGAESGEPEPTISLDDLTDHVREVVGSWGLWIELALMIAKFLFEIWIETKSIPAVRLASDGLLTLPYLSASDMAEVYSDQIRDGHHSIAAITRVFVAVGEHEETGAVCAEPIL